MFIFPHSRYLSVFNFYIKTNEKLIDSNNCYDDYHCEVWRIWSLLGKLISFQEHYRAIGQGLSCIYSLFSIPTYFFQLMYAGILFMEKTS